MVRTTARGATAIRPSDATAGTFGTTLPASVTTVRIGFASDSGQRCCLAVNPSLLPIDPASGLRTLVLTDLPSGDATVTFAGFPTPFAPAEDGAEDVCPASPANAAGACDPTQAATPSFEADPFRVTIIEGSETDAGDIPVFAVPFLLQASPGMGGAAVSPVPISVTVVDAGAGVDQGSIALSATQNGSAFNLGSPSVVACADGTANPCSSGGSLAVTGFEIGTGPTAFSLGTVQVRVQAQNVAPTPRTLDFSYAFAVQPKATPTARPTPTPLPNGGVVILQPPANIAAAARSAAPGATLVVAPGEYAAVALGAGDLAGPITVIGDVTGALSGSVGGPIVINASGQSAAVSLSDLADVIIDGVTFRGGTDGAVRVERSTGIIIRNCTMTATPGDGLRVEGSGGVVVFNNLIFNNSGAGARVLTTGDAQFVNNTVYHNLATGLFVAQSSALVVRNNIFNQNRTAGISVDASTTGFDGDYDLNTDGYAGVAAGVHDLTGAQADPLFILPSQADFHLQRGLSGATSPAIDAGDPATDPEFVAALETRSTATDGTLDLPPVDLGYHYLPGGPSATPLPSSGS